ncbi:alpha-endosulfine [Striga asiatica]|uniref:Alpha-endosulfine n=1 Tax=Striga asiatica TaxID=4170 RepID=A0A5A7QQH1_STRAF|nr:alpha-endosulfine [Striga asiatica]
MRENQDALGVSFSRSTKMIQIRCNGHTMEVLFSHPDTIYEYKCLCGTSDDHETWRDPPSKEDASTCVSSTTSHTPTCCHAQPAYNPGDIEDRTRNSQGSRMIHPENQTVHQSRLRDLRMSPVYPASTQPPDSASLDNPTTRQREPQQPFTDRASLGHQRTRLQNLRQLATSGPRRAVVSLDHLQQLGYDPIAVQKAQGNARPD